MQDTHNWNAGRVVPVESLKDYFRNSIEEAIARQHVQVDPDTAHYVVNLMTLFARSEQLYDGQGDECGLKPLALMLADAVDAESAEQRSYLLQRIGDVSLFISGFFADSLIGKAVDIDYYIRMGGSAYDTLSNSVQRTFRGNAFAPIYRELAVKFQAMVDVLHEVRDSAGTGSDTDLLRTYEIWLKTGSERAARILKSHNVVPIRAGDAGRSH
ncbi:MAG TPA: hypothetical protein PKK10_03165 [Woeseiaceae bacterium]|nr:hypothetical protein [Woeseiaceae bacterium]